MLVTEKIPKNNLPAWLQIDGKPLAYDGNWVDEGGGIYKDVYFIPKFDKSGFDRVDQGLIALEQEFGGVDQEIKDIAREIKALAIPFQEVLTRKIALGEEKKGMYILEIDLNHPEFTSAALRVYKKKREVVNIELPVGNFGNRANLKYSGINGQLMLISTGEYQDSYPLEKSMPIARFDFENKQALIFESEEHEIDWLVGKNKNPLGVFRLGFGETYLQGGQSFRLIDDRENNRIGFVFDSGVGGVEWQEMFPWNLGEGVLGVLFDQNARQWAALPFWGKFASMVKNK